MSNAMEFAKQFDGIEYGGDTLDNAAARAAKYGVVTLYGYSDDNIEIRGPGEGFSDEVAAYGGVTFRLDRQGLVYFPDLADLSREDPSDHIADNIIAELNRRKNAAVIIVSDCPWEFSGDFITNYGHKFRVMEDGDLYGEGVCIDVDKLPAT